MADKKKVSRRGYPRYAHNPSVKRVQESMDTGTRAIKGKSGDHWMFVNSETGEERPAGFHQRVPVDKTRFVKVFTDGVRNLMGLSKSAAALFEHIFEIVSDNPSNDRLVLSFMEVTEQPGLDMAERTFHRAMRELLDAEIIYESTTPNLYWLNIQFMFNGDRLAFVREYVREDAVEASGSQGQTDEQQRQQLEADGQQRLDEGELNESS